MLLELYVRLTRTRLDEQVENPQNETPIAGLRRCISGVDMGAGLTLCLPRVVHSDPFRSRERKHVVAPLPLAFTTQDRDFGI